MAIVLTGKCRACKSDHAQEITQMLIDGVKLADIAGAFPGENLTASILTKHRAHFVAPRRADDVDVTDHVFIDRLRRLADDYIEKGLSGARLSLAETRIIQTATTAMLGRSRIEDSQSQLDALTKLLEEATASTWDLRGEAEDV